MESKIDKITDNIIIGIVCSAFIILPFMWMVFILICRTFYFFKIYTFLNCINSTPEMTIFQTGPLNSLNSGLFTLILLLHFFIVFYFLFWWLCQHFIKLLCEFKNWLNTRQFCCKKNKIHTFLFRSHTNAIITDLIYKPLVLLFSFVASGTMICIILSGVFDPIDISGLAISEKIIIDESEQVINVEQYYVLREENHQILFDEIDHITYSYNIGYGEGNFPSANVKVIKLNGKKIKIYHGYGFEANIIYNLAEAIAEATGKEIVKQKIT